MAPFDSHPCGIPLQSASPPQPAPQTPALLLVVLRDLGGLALDVLQHLLNRWPSQKACPQRLIPDPLRQSLDDPRRLTKGDTRLRRLARCIIQRPQRRLDLPLFSRQLEVCCQLGGLAQVAESLLVVPIPR